MLFKRYKDNPIISPNPNNKYEKDGTYNPTATVHDNKVYLFYRAEDKLHPDDLPQYATSQICLAISEDGYNFKKYENNPVIRPTLPEEGKSCEDPRITKINDEFYLTYTAFDGKFPKISKNVYTALATSKDLINWEKQGIILKKLKAAVISPEKVNGKYIMFIGGSNIKVAKSTDLISWDVEDNPILDIRHDKFDNKYVETGPPPLIYKDKLVLFFNTADINGIFHPSFALLDKNNPRKVLFRANEPLMSPSEDYEVKGNIRNVIFGSGLIKFKGKYFYYYGAADSYVCVATVEKKELENYFDSLLG